MCVEGTCSQDAVTPEHARERKLFNKPEPELVVDESRIPHSTCCFCCCLYLLLGLIIIITHFIK